MFRDLGTRLRIPPDLLKAVAIVECGLDLTGMVALHKPKILFEGHIFYRELKNVKPTIVKRILKSHPTICYEKWTKKFYLGGIDEWDRYNEAYQIDPQCAMLSTSWGIGQIMGFNYNLCGCVNVEFMVEKMCESEYQQMELWYYFLYNSRLVHLLLDHDWEAFARKYNGPGQVTLYANKLRNAYNNLKGKV